MSEGIEETSLLELVELSNGDVALRRVSDSDISNDSLQSLEAEFQAESKLEPQSAVEPLSESAADSADSAQAAKPNENEPLLRIQFSEESEFALDTLKMTIARAMVEAGIEAYAEIQAVRVAEEEAEGEGKKPVIH
jgi:hypothetical protein